MFRTPVTPATGGRHARIALGLVVGVLSASVAHAQAASAQQPTAQQPPAQHPPTQQPSQPPAQPAQQAQAPPTTHVFGSDAGMVLNFIKADKTADFEAVVMKVKEALAKSDKPERKQQAAGWRVFKALEPAGAGTALYVFFIDPPVKGADYTVSVILAEAFPQEVNTLYKQYAESYDKGQNFVNLTLVAALGK